MKALFMKAIQFVKNAAQWVWNGLKKIGNTIKNFFQKIVSSVKNFFKKDKKEDKIGENAKNEGVGKGHATPKQDKQHNSNKHKLFDDVPA